MTTPSAAEELAELREAVEGFEALFELQHQRSVEATRQWRIAHPGNDLVMPDLGSLLTWLLEDRRALAEWVRHALDDHDCDRDGYEVISGIANTALAT